jgi:hypothetical protein
MVLPSGRSGGWKPNSFVEFQGLKSSEGDFSDILLKLLIEETFMEAPQDGNCRGVPSRLRLGIKNRAVLGRLPGFWL